MPQGDMRDFVGHHAGKLRLTPGRSDRACVDIDGSAGKRESVDLVVAYDFKRIRIARLWREARQTAPERGNASVGRNGVLPLDLLGGVAAELDLLVDGDHVKAARTDSAPLRVGGERRQYQSDC